MSEEQRPIPVTTERPAPRADSEVDPERVPAPAQGGESLTPPIDIHEGADGLVLEADLPGVTEKTLTVQLEDNVLYLLAAVDPVAVPTAPLIHQEYRPGQFARSFILSDEVDRTRISAEIKNGVLRVLMPRSERAQTRRIEVKAP